MTTAPRIIAAIGNMDGVHRGHQFLLAETIKHAESLDGVAGAVFFDPHPRRFFRPEDPPFLITTPARRRHLLQSAGAAHVFALTFNRAMASMTPARFVNDVLAGQLGLAGVVTGADFRFGAGRAGDAAALKQLCENAGLAMLIVTPLQDSSQIEKYSSSLVRTAITTGDVALAAKMLGAPWTITGTVAPGQKLGRTLGFPTANLTLGEIIQPRAGVYAVQVATQDQRYGGVANFGRRPTVGAPAPLLEVHLFDFDGDLYGAPIDVTFIDFIRDERKFDGLDPLKEQIARDSRRAREILAHTE